MGRRVGGGVGRLRGPGTPGLGTPGMRTGMRLGRPGMGTPGVEVAGAGMLPVGVTSAVMVTLTVVGASTTVVASAGAVAWTLAATVVVMPSAEA